MPPVPTKKTPRWARQDAATMPNQFQFSRQTFISLEEAILDNMHSSVRATWGIDPFVRLCILVTKGIVQKRSRGPVAPRHRSVPALAYKIPVQRITGRYYAGWTIRRIRDAVWMLYNDTREAIIIEDGLYGFPPRRILRYSAFDMLRMIQTTRTGDMFVDWVLASRRDASGRFRSFQQRAFGITSGLSLAGPQGYLP